jgi:UDP-glucose 4-epimerase
MSAKEVLVVGGAGYIGSHMLLLLKQAGFKPVVLDNLSTGHQDAVFDAEIIIGDIADHTLLTDVFSKHQFIAVMHFASRIEVAESVASPDLYYQNNVAAFVNLLNVMCAHNVKNIIFSSSAAVYGEPQAQRINEKHRLQPVNPYGRTKRMAEEMLIDYAAAGKLNYAILRYFNAAGADPSARLGERHTPESHLIPLLLQVAAGKKPAITINGEDYPSADGTCVRDYIHISDICSAHLLVLNALLKGKSNLVFNLGTGQGYTVKQVINAARRVTGHPIPTQSGKMRAGDPAVLVADAELIKQELGWQPRYQDLDTIIQHAWAYQQKNPQ